MLLRTRRNISEEDFQELLRRTRTLETLSTIPPEAMQPTRTDWGLPTTLPEITTARPSATSAASIEAAIVALLN